MTPLELTLAAPGSNTWNAEVEIRLCPVGARQSTLGMCSKTLYSMDRQGAELAQWIDYHLAIGVDTLDVYDIDGSAAATLDAFPRTASLNYFPLFPAHPQLRNLTMGGGVKFPAVDCLQPVQQMHCLLRHRAQQSKWVVSWLSPDEYLGTTHLLPKTRQAPQAVIHRYLNSVSRDVVSLEMVSVLFGEPEGLDHIVRTEVPVTQAFQGHLKFSWDLQGRPVYSRGRSWGCFASLVRPAHVLSLHFEVARPYPGGRKRALPPGILRINHYVNMLKRRVVVPADQLVDDDGTRWSWPMLQRWVGWSPPRARNIMRTDSRRIRHLARVTAACLDVDGDGVVSLGEWRALWDPNRFHPASGGDDVREIKILDFALHSVGVWWGALGDTRTLFKAADRDANGVLSEWELIVSMLRASDVRGLPYLKE